MEHPMEHLEGLNPGQKEAAMHIKGPILIIAGAGAGKTKTITHRIVNLIKEGVRPENILAVTFTNKAAKEMRERVEKEIEKSAKGQDRSPYIATFHALGVHIIKENAGILGLTRHFSILDEGEANSIIKEVMKEIGVDPKENDPKKIRNIISREKGAFRELSEYRAEAKSSLGQLVSRIWPLYEEKKKKENSLDFDDLILKSTKLLDKNQEVKEMYQQRWQYIHIDEYQDTNEVQYRMARLLSEAHQNICVVGDADQNIYSWRGANLRNILSFEKDYKNAKVVMLEENYRSTQNILEAANVVIKKNKFRPDKNLFTKNKTGEKIGLYEALDEGDEADFVATKILELLDSATDVPMQGFSQADGPRGSAPRARGDSDPVEAASEALTNFRADNSNILSEIAILYRANFQSRVLEEAMLRYNIPYQVLGVKFFERKEIKDTLAYLRAALNQDNLSDIKRSINFPSRGIGKVTLAKIFAGTKEELPPKVLVKVENFYRILGEIKEKIFSSSASGAVKFAVKYSGIEDELRQGTEEDQERLANIKELATLALKYDNLENGLGIEKLLEDAALASDQDSLLFNPGVNDEKKEKKNAVKLMTVHASKGLEFKYVFIVGLESGLFPNEHEGRTEENEDGEEERRLFYVALTRAREKLFLSFANFRTIFGSRQINAPGEFIADIPSELLEREGEKGGIKTIYI